MPPLKRTLSTTARGGAAKKSRGGASIATAKSIAINDVVDLYQDYDGNPRRVGWGVLTSVQGTQHHRKSTNLKGKKFICCVLKQVYGTNASCISLPYPWLGPPDEEPIMLSTAIGHIVLWDRCIVAARRLRSSLPFACAAGSSCSSLRSSAAAGSSAVTASGIVAMQPAPSASQEIVRGNVDDGGVIDSERVTGVGHEGGSEINKPELAEDKSKSAVPVKRRGASPAVGERAAREEIGHDDDAAVEGLMDPEGIIGAVNNGSMC